MRRVDNICSSPLTVSSVLTLESPSLLHSLHFIVTYFNSSLLLPVPLCFQYINLYHCFPSFPLCPSPWHCLVHTLFLLSFILFSFHCFYFFPSLVLTLLPCLLQHPSPFAYTFFPLKNTKSRGSKHKSRRKSKKQKRPSSVCNSPSLRPKVVTVSLSLISRINVLVPID